MKPQEGPPRDWFADSLVCSFALGGAIILVFLLAWLAVVLWQTIDAQGGL